MYREKKEQGIISEGEFRKAIIEKAVTFFENAHIFDKIQQLLKSENIKENISFEEFKDFIIRVNGILREIPIKDRDTDGKNVYLSGSDNVTYLPKYEDKEALLIEVYNSIDKIDKNDLQYFIPLMITAIHIFKDGNGRTSRVFNHLLSGHVSKEDFYFELDKALDIDGRYQSKNINPEYINKHIIKVLLNKNNIDTSVGMSNPLRLHIKQGLNILDHELFDRINEINKDFINLWGSDKDFGNLIILKYLDKVDKLNLCMKDDVISMDLMNKNLDKNDWENMIDEFYIGKKEMIEIMIDIFVNPDDYHVDEMNPSTIKDLLISRVNRQ